MIYSRNPLQLVNIFLIVLLGPLIVGVILKILAVTKFKESRLFDRGWMYSFGTFTFYGMMFLSYAYLSMFITNFLHADQSSDFWLGMSVEFVYCIVLICYLVASYKYKQWFGSFKNKFQRYNSSQHWYTFEAIERAMTSIIAVCMSPYPQTPVIMTIPFVLQLLFLIVRKPYVL